MWSAEVFLTYTLVYSYIQDRVWCCLSVGALCCMQREALIQLKAHQHLSALGAYNPLLQSPSHQAPAAHQQLRGAAAMMACHPALKAQLLQHLLQEPKSQLMEQPSTVEYNQRGVVTSITNHHGPRAYAATEPASRSPQVHNIC